MNFPTRRFAALLSFVALSSVAPSAYAVGPLDTFSARIGGYVTKFDTKVRADGTTTIGTTVDLDRDLDMNQDQVVGFVGLAWRPWEHHEFGISYYGTDSSKTKVLERDIEFGGTVYEAQSTVRGDFSGEGYEAYYVWWAASRENWALGPRLGLLWYSLSLELDMQLDANGNQVGGSISNDGSLDVPAPTLGGSWRWTPSEDWRISADGGYFAAKIDSIDADVWFGRIGVEWFPWERSGFWLDYVINNVKADEDI